MKHRYENEQNINKIKNYDTRITLMKNKNLINLSLRTSNPLIYIIYNFYIFIKIWLIV